MVLVPCSCLFGGSRGLQAPEFARLDEVGFSPGPSFMLPLCRSLCLKSSVLILLPLLPRTAAAFFKWRPTQAFSLKQSSATVAKAALSFMPLSLCPITCTPSSLLPPMSRLKRQCNLSKAAFPFALRASWTYGLVGSTSHRYLHLKSLRLVRLISNRILFEQV